MKVKTSFTLDDACVALLKKLAEKNNRSAANQLEELIKLAAKEAKILKG